MPRTKLIGSRRRNLTRRTGQNIRKASRGRRFDSKAEGSTGEDMENADGSSERNGIFLRSEADETRLRDQSAKRSLLKTNNRRDSAMSRLINSNTA